MPAFRHVVSTLPYVLEITCTALFIYCFEIYYLFELIIFFIIHRTSPEDKQSSTLFHLLNKFKI